MKHTKYVFLQRIGTLLFGKAPDLECSHLHISPNLLTSYEIYTGIQFLYTDSKTSNTKLLWQTILSNDLSTKSYLFSTFKAFLDEKNSKQVFCKD